MASTRTWHPHIYHTPPKKPTPYFVATILGLDSSHMPAFTTTVTEKPNRTTQIQQNGTESKRVEEAIESKNDGKKSDSQGSSDDLGKFV